MFVSPSMEIEGMVLRRLFMDYDAPLLLYCCRGGTLDALTEGFEVLVMFFCGVLVLCCLLCCSSHCCSTAALQTVSYHFGTCETFLESIVKGGWFRLQQYISRKGGKFAKHVEGVWHLDPSLNSCTVAGAPNYGVRHVAVIMDGNRRYGKRTASTAVPAETIANVCESVLFSQDDACRGKEEMYAALLSLLRHTALDGHRRGGEKLMEFIDDCLDLGISMLTVYAFSTENWDRSSLEVNVLMALFCYYIERIRQTAREKGIFIRFISPVFEKMFPHVRDIMVSVEEETRKHRPRRIVVNVCVSYSGRDEILNACNRLAQRVEKSAPISNGDLMGQMLRSVTQEGHEEEDADALAGAGGVEPQVLLRTSGEQRLSNFLLYECAYTEFVFVDKTWPEVTRDDVIHLLHEFGQRNRRHGR